MPVEVRGALELRKAIKKFSPDLAKETRKELATLLAPIVKTARGFIPGDAPLSGWGRSATTTGKFPIWDSKAAKSGIGYKTSPSKPNKQGFKALARIVNVSAAGTIYETAGRVNPGGRPQSTTITKKKSYYEYSYTRSGTKKESNSTNPQAGKQFIDSTGNHGDREITINEFG